MIMEYLQGETVHAQLKQGAGRLPLGRVLELCRQAAETLVATHEKGIIHRDLKPENLMMIPRLRLRLRRRRRARGWAFGSRCSTLGSPSCDPSTWRRSDDCADRRAVSFWGRRTTWPPSSASPTMPQTDQVDVYALGTVVFRCLAGRTPFVTEAKGDAGLMHLCAQQIGEPPPLSPVRARDSPGDSRPGRETLRKEAARRPTMKQLADRLADFQRRGVGASVHRDSSDDLPTIRSRSARRDLVTGPAAAGRPVDRRYPESRSRDGASPDDALKWWHLVLIVVTWCRFAALLGWSLGGAGG